MTTTAANNNPVTPQIIQSSAFQSVVRNQQSLESGNAGSFPPTSASAAVTNENLLSSSLTYTRPQTNTDLVQQEQTTSSSSSNLHSKIVRVLRDDDDARRCESPSAAAADCQKIPNSASSSETNFCRTTDSANVQQNAAVAPPPDCLARLETPDCLYFVCKKRLVIGRETAHSTADVSFKKTFVSRAHLELTFVASSINAAAKNDNEDYDDAAEDVDDDETTSRDDGVWLLKCNGKNGILINNVQFNKDEAERVLPAECILRFPSTDIQLHFWYSNNCRNFSQQRLQQQQQQQSQLISPVTPVTTPAAEFDQNGVNCSSSSAASSLQTCSIHPEDPACTSSKLQDEDSRFKNADDLDSSIEKSNNRTPSLDYDFEQADADESSDCDGFSAADDKDGKPPYSYAQLIVQAIASTEDKQMTLAGIYAYITKHYAYYRTCDKGWQNSIRHNLSLCRHFVRVPRTQDEPGKGSFWRIDPSCETKQIQTAYKKRRQGKNSICLASSTTATAATSTFSTTAPQNLNLLNNSVGYPTSPKQIDAAASATIVGFNNAPMNSTYYGNGYGMSGNSSKTSSPVAWSSNENAKLQDILSPSSIDHYTRTFQSIDSNHSQTTTTMPSIQRHSSSTDSFYSNQSSSLSLPFQRRVEDDGTTTVVALNSPSSSSIDRWNLKINQAATTTARNNFTNNKIDAVYCNGKDANEDVLARKNGTTPRVVSTVIEFAGDTTSKENEIARKFSPPAAEQNATTIFSNESSQCSFLLPQHSSSSTPFYDEQQASNAAKNVLQQMSLSPSSLFPNVIAGDVPSSRGDTICVVNNRTASLKLPIAPKNETSSTATVHFKDDHLTHEYEPLEYGGAGGSASSTTDCRQNSENSQKSNDVHVVNNQNAVALSISPHLKNLMQENCASGKFSRFLSKSAPSSPKAYSKKTTSSAYQPTEKDLGRSGGTFSVRRNASDGRQRLQICHSPPFHVPVESAETSALRAMMQDSQAARSRRNSGQVAAASPSATSSTARPGGGGVLSSVPSTLMAAANRIGSKSLSTTPTREPLTGTSPSRYEYGAQKVTGVNQPSNAGLAKRSTLDQLSAKQKALRFSHQRHSIDGGATKTVPPPTPTPSSNVYAGGAAAAHQQTMVNNAFLQAGNTTGLQQALQHRSAPASPLNLLNFLPSNHHAAAAAAVLAAGLTPPYHHHQQQQQTQAAQQRSPSTAAVAAAAANLANANPYANLLNNSNMTAAVLNNLVVAAAANQAALMFPALGYDAASAAPLLAAAGLLPSTSVAANHQSPLYAAALANNFLANLTSAAAAAAAANDQQQYSSPSPNGESPSSNNNAAAAATMAAILLAQRQRTQQQTAATATLALPTNLSPPAILLNGNNVVLGGEQGGGGGGKRAGDSLQQHFAPKMSRH